MLFKETIAVYSETHTKPITFCGQNAELLNVKAGGLYSYHCVLKGWPKQVRRFITVFKNTIIELHSEPVLIFKTYLLQINFNIILPCLPRYLKWSLSDTGMLRPEVTFKNTRMNYVHSS
jgi:hypothetical protein